MKTYLVVTSTFWDRMPKSYQFESIHVCHSLPQKWSPASPKNEWLNPHLSRIRDRSRYADYTWSQIFIIDMYLTSYQGLPQLIGSVQVILKNKDPFKEIWAIGESPHIHNTRINPILCWCSYVQSSNPILSSLKRPRSNKTAMGVQSGHVLCPPRQGG